DLAHFPETARGHRAARTAHAEELLFLKLPGVGGVGDEHQVEVAVLTSQALDRPEEKSLGNLSLALAHAAGDVQQQDDHGLHGRLLALGELAVAQIVIGERRPFCAGRALHTAALDRFLERAASVESRARTATVPAFAGPVVLFGATGFCFQVGKLHLFPQPVNDIFDSKLQRILDSALLVAALTALRIALLLWPADAIARLRLSLPDALLLVRVAQTEPIVL